MSIAELRGCILSKWKRAKVTPEQKSDKKRIKELERELRRKDKALAETAALLVLGKKFDAYWKDKEDSWFRWPIGKIMHS